MPSKIITPILLRRIRQSAPDANIKILVATGFHRQSTQQELIDKYGQEIVAREQIVMHVATDDAAMVKIGTLPSGGECIVNKTAAEADLLLSQGFIEPHLFAGFSGGRKLVLPGISSYKTIMANHCSEFINSSNARPGILLDNPIHQDMLYAAKNRRPTLHRQCDSKWRKEDNRFLFGGLGKGAREGMRVSYFTRLGA